MEWLRFGSRTAGLLAALYAATVVELSWPANDFTPSWIALAVTFAIAVNRTSASVAWAAVGGFVIDATARGPFGAVLMAYGFVAGFFVTLVPAGRRTWWFTPTVAFTLATVLPVVQALIAHWDGGSLVEPALLWKPALLRGCTTAFAATVCVMLYCVTQRLLSPSVSSQPLQLSNRWTMLTE